MSFILTGGINTCRFQRLAGTTPDLHGHDPFLRTLYVALFHRPLRLRSLFKVPPVAIGRCGCAGVGSAAGGPQPGADPPMDNTPSILPLIDTKIGTSAPSITDQQGHNPDYRCQLRRYSTNRSRRGGASRILERPLRLVA